MAAGFFVLHDRYALPDEFQLPKTAELLRRIQPSPINRVGNLTNVEVPLRIHAKPVGRYELSRPIAKHCVANARQPLSSGIERVQAVANHRVIGQLSVHEHLANVDNSFLIHAQRLRPVDVLPYRLQIALAVEDLETIVLTICDVNVLIFINDNVVGHLKLARLNTR